MLKSTEDARLELEVLIGTDVKNSKLESASLIKSVQDLYLRYYGHFRFGLVTALPKEAAAVRSSLDNVEELYHFFSSVNYWSGTYPGPKGHPPHSVVLVLCKKMGNSSSAVATTALLKDFPHVDEVLMVGIAGGIPDLEEAEKDVRLGDILVSKGAGLVQYDLIKIDETKIKVRSEAPTPSAKMVGAAEILETERVGGTRRWEAHLERCTKIELGKRPPPSTDKLRNLRKYDEKKDPRRRSGLPVVHYGTIASANALLKKAELRDQLKTQFGVIGVEMEGSGLADGAWFDGCGYLIVRGVCDYCDNDKNDVWQGYAAAVAAAYTRSLFEVLPPRGQDGTLLRHSE